MLSPLATVIKENLVKFMWHTGVITCTFTTPATRETMIFNITFSEFVTASGANTFEKIRDMDMNTADTDYVATILADMVIKSERMQSATNNIIPFFAPAQTVIDKGTPQYTGKFDKLVIAPTGTTLIYLHSYEYRRGLKWSWEARIDIPEYEILAVYKVNDSDELYLVHRYAVGDGVHAPTLLSSDLIKSKLQCYEYVFHYAL